MAGERMTHVAVACAFRRTYFASVSEDARLVQLGEGVWPVGSTGFLIVNAQAGGSGGHQLPSLADGLHCGRKLEIDGRASLFGVDDETHVSHPGPKDP